MDYTIKGIKCDACDYKNESVSWEDVEQTGKDYINRPCPLCGANLLTQDDFDSTKRLLFVMSALEEISIEVYGTDGEENEKQQELTVTSDGTGNKKIKTPGINFNLSAEIITQLDAILKMPNGREMVKNSLKAQNN